jgi:hypothetical protein
MSKIENELYKLGFVPNRASNWTRKHDIVQIVHSTEYPKVRVTWREYWEDFLAIIYDYSPINGPICIVPTKELFNQPFVSRKRMEQAYVNSGNYWSQNFNLSDDLAQFILGFENRWDIIGGSKDEKCVHWPKDTINQETNSQLKVHPRYGEPNIKTVEKRSDFSGMCKAFGDKDLIHLYCDLMEELRKREITVANNVVADYGEKVVVDKLNLKRSRGSNKGYDAIDEKTGLTYQIKSRQLTRHNGASSRQLGVIRDLENRPFDYLVAVIFDESMEPKEMLKLPIEIISKYSRYIKRINGHVLILAGKIMQDRAVESLLQSS